MKLWSGVLSPFSAKVRIALGEKDLAFEVLEIPWSREKLWGPKPPDFLAVSPHGKVPVLVDGEVTLHDSTIINEYLDERYPDPPLLPKDAIGRARCRQLEDEADTTMDRDVTVLIQEVFRKADPATREAERVDEAKSGLARYFDALEKALADREYLCGDFSLADVSTFMVVMFASSMEAAPSEAHADLGAWMARMSARPVVAREAAAMLAAASAA